MMASSYMSFSLLAKGIGHVTKNGHEKLDVILEPEDYYNLQSYESEINAFQRKTRESDGHRVAGEIPLHKTFITRKGALLLFSEDLAKKGQWEEPTQRRKVRNKKELSWMTPFDATTLEHAGEDILKTCHDLSWAILSYGNKPEYRKRGEELYLRFVHHNNERNKETRKIRPGFSPKRYISTWSHQWDNDLIEKLISKGMIADKTLFTQNPHQLSGKFTNYNLSDRPTPYRITPNMLVGSTGQPEYEFYSFGDNLGEDPGRKILSTPPPSQDESPREDQEEDVEDEEDVIQALKYHENGTIQQVEYSELQPKEKESILAELLVAAHEHQQNIRNTLTMITEDPSDGASESGAESLKAELVMDMNEAIMSLIASPVKQQMMERKQVQQQQQQDEQEELELLKTRAKLANERMKSKETDDKNDQFSHTIKPLELDPISARPSNKGPLKRGGNHRKTTELSDEELMTSYMNEQAAGEESTTTTTTKMAPAPYKEKKDSLTSSFNKPLQVLFQPPISMNGTPKYSSSNTSSKRRGAMPISSNIVRQTLAGNLSILSASTQQPNYDINVRNIAEQISVPLPSIPEPSRQHGKMPAAFSTLGNPPLTHNNTSSSPTGREGDDDGERPQNSDHPEQHRRPQQEKNAVDRDEDPYDPNQNDPTLKSSLRGSTKSSQSSKLSQTRSRGLRTKLVPALPSEKRYLHVEIPFHGMRGGRGPGSQSSSSLIKSTGEPKKTESRNLHPQVMKKQQQQQSYASVCMPDGEIMSIGGSITQSISTKDESHDYDYYNEDKSSTLLGSDERKRIIRSSNIKSATSSSYEGGSLTKRRVSFMEERKIMEIGRHEDENDHDSNTHYSMSDSRPTSSISSEKIIKHAKKVAAIVVNQQRPTSRLDDDARKAAQVWNEVIVDEEADKEFEYDNVDDESGERRTSNISVEMKPSTVKIPQASNWDDKDEDKTTASRGDDGADFNEDEEGYLLRAANKNTSKRNSLRSLASNTSSHHRDQRADDDEEQGPTSASRQTLHVDLQDKFGAESESSAMSTARDDASSKYTATTKISVQAVDGSNSDTARKSDASAKGKTDLLKELTSTNHEAASPSKSKSKKPASSKSKASSKSSENKKKKRKEKKEQQQTISDPPAPRAGVPAESNNAEDSDFSPREDNKTRKEKKRSGKKDPETQVEKLLEGSDHSSRESDGNESKRKTSVASTRTPSEAFLSPVQTPVDDYDFVRVEEEFADDQEEEDRGGMRERYDTKQDRILTDQILKPAGKRSPTAQEEDEDQGSGRSEESKAKMLAAKEERMSKRAAAADRRRMEVERKRREKDELQTKQRDEQGRKEQMQEQLEEERRQREEDLRKKKEQAELEKIQEQEEEEARKRRTEQQVEREKRMEEEKRKKREELQRKRKEDEEKRKEFLRIQEEEEAERKIQEEEMLAQMEEEERIQYQEKMKTEREEKERLDLERRLKEEEEVRKAMEFARGQAILKAHEQAILQQKLEFVRNMKDEGEKMGQARKISRAYNFSYFELLKLLGLDVPV